MRFLIPQLPNSQVDHHRGSDNSNPLNFGLSQNPIAPPRTHITYEKIQDKTDEISESDESFFVLLFISLNIYI